MQHIDFLALVIFLVSSAEIKHNAQKKGSKLWHPVFLGGPKNSSLNFVASEGLWRPTEFDVKEKQTETVAMNR